MPSQLDKLLALQRARVFASLSADELWSVAHLCAVVTVDVGEELFQQGDLGEALYLIVHGRVSIERDGVILAHLGEDELVGELGVLDWEPHSATAAASEPTLMLRLDRHDLFDLLADMPGLARNLSEMIVGRVRRARVPSQPAGTPI